MTNPQKKAILHEKSASSETRHHLRYTSINITKLENVFSLCVGVVATEVRLAVLINKIKSNVLKQRAGKQRQKQKTG